MIHTANFLRAYLRLHSAGMIWDVETPWQVYNESCLYLTVQEVKDMPVTITLNDNLATRLQLQALTQRVSLEQWALSILGHAAEHPRELQTWAALNQRRFALIDKRHSVGLDEAEEREFAQLQAAVAGLLKPWDRALIEKLEPYEALTS